MTPPATVQAPRVPHGSSAPPELQPAPRRHRGWRWTALALAVLLLVLGGGWLVAYSPVFAAHRVQVNGVRALTPDQVRQAAAVPLGRPLARQDLDAIASRVAALRLVRSVQVSRSWPRSMTIDVQERTAVLALRQASGFALVDAQGQVYSSAPTVPHQVVLADVHPVTPTLLAGVGTVAAALPAELNRRVGSVTATSLDSIKLRLTDGDTVRWGSPEESELKARVLTGLLTHKARTYDVSAPRSPTLR